MTRLIRKFGATALALTAAIALTGSSAFAFECYNASRSEQGNESAANSAALVGPADLLVFFCGLSPEAAAARIAELEDEGFETDILINGHALMAGGLERNGKGEEKLHDGQAIDHMSDALFGALVSTPGCEDAE
jgi:hypothetical protein